ncbi:MAG TPA: hypothetical protein VGO57_01675 [Verrucomicrobiae bacterium]|jgi:hypothetical protein
MNNDINVPVKSEGNEVVRQRLVQLRDALLHLHKILIESERVGYEKTFGKIETSYQLLHLLTVDPWFTWLRPVSQMVTAMDEALDSREPLTLAGVEVLAARCKALLSPTTGGEGFAAHYDEAVQRDADVLFAHVAATRLLSPPAAPPKPVA